jgi:hypothetical protein
MSLVNPETEVSVRRMASQTVRWRQVIGLCPFISAIRVLRGSLAALAWNRHSLPSVGSRKARPHGPREHFEENAWRNPSCKNKKLASLR